MSRPLDEFVSPLKIYHSTRDANGDRRQVRLTLPESLVSGMERFMRSNTTYLSLHQYMMNCLYYGQEMLETHGMADSPVEFRLAVEIEDLVKKQQVTKRILDGCRDLWRNAETAEEKTEIQDKIREAAKLVSDPEKSTELLRIIRP